MVEAETVNLFFANSTGTIRLAVRQRTTRETSRTSSMFRGHNVGCHAHGFRQKDHQTVRSSHAQREGPTRATVLCFMAAESGLPVAERLRGKVLSVHMFHSNVKTVSTVFVRQSQVLPTSIRMFPSSLRQYHHIELLG